MSTNHPLVGQRAYVDDEYYAGPAIILEYDPTDIDFGRHAPFYCHLLDLCLFHEDGEDEACDDPNDECMGEACSIGLRIGPPADRVSPRPPA